MQTQPNRKEPLLEEIPRKSHAPKKNANSWLSGPERFAASLLSTSNISGHGWKLSWVKRWASGKDPHFNYLVKFKSKRDVERAINDMEAFRYQLWLFEHSPQS